AGGRVGAALRGAAANLDVRLVRPQAHRLARALHAAHAGVSDSRERALPAPAALRRRLLRRDRGLHRAAADRQGLQHLRTGEDRLHRPDARREGGLRGARRDRAHSLFGVLVAALALRLLRPRSAVHPHAARGAGDARRLRADRLARYLRREGNAAAGSAPRNVPRSDLFARRAGILMSRVVVIGAGAMGLAAAYHALKQGHAVTVLEAAGEAGGMAAHFSLGGLSIERYYHFVCKADQPTFALMAELGIGDKMRWVPTSMGYYVDGELYPWGDPFSLLRFPKLFFFEKLRYGAMMFFSTRRRDANSLEKVAAKDWITRWCGAAVYERLWAPLFRLKFFEYADNISAAWIWTRIKRVGTSRKSLLQEELGYIEGGSQTLVQALTKAIAEKGGKLRLNVPVIRIEIKDKLAVGVIAGGEFFPADAVISTVPTPYVGKLVPDMPAEERARYE